MVFRAGIAAVVLLGVCGASLSIAASAASTKCDPGPSQADKDACTPDVYAHCGDLVPNAEAITICLRKKVSLLSAACHKVMTRPPSKLPPCRTDQSTRD